MGESQGLDHRRRRHRHLYRRRWGLLGEALALAALFAVAACGSLLGWAALGAGTARLLRDPAALRWFNRGMAALLVASLVPVLAG